MQVRTKYFSQNKCKWELQKIFVEFFSRRFRKIDLNLVFRLSLLIWSLLFLHPSPPFIWILTLYLFDTLIYEIVAFVPKSMFPQMFFFWKNSKPIFSVFFVNSTSFNKEVFTKKCNNCTETTCNLLVFDWGHRIRNLLVGFVASRAWTFSFFICFGLFSSISIHWRVTLKKVHNFFGLKRMDVPLVRVVFGESKFLARGCSGRAW